MVQDHRPVNIYTFPDASSIRTHMLTMAFADKDAAAGELVG